MKKLFLLIVCLVACVNAYTQDIIVLSDGSSIQAKIEKITPTEIEYKKASNLTGPTYTMNVNDVVLIEYQNGTREVFNRTSTDNAPVVNANTAYRTQETASGFSSDNELRAIYYRSNTDNDYGMLMKKAKTWKIVGWTVGPGLVIAGGILMGIGISWSLDDDGCPPFVCGSILTAAGITTTALCVYQSNKLNNQARYFASTAPLYNHYFVLDNGNLLSLSIDAMCIGPKHEDLGVGFGIRYNF